MKSEIMRPPLVFLFPRMVLDIKSSVSHINFKIFFISISLENCDQYCTEFVDCFSWCVKITNSKLMISDQNDSDEIPDD